MHSDWLVLFTDLAHIGEKILLGSIFDLNSRLATRQRLKYPVRRVAEIRK